MKKINILRTALIIGAIVVAFYLLTVEAKHYRFRFGDIFKIIFIDKTSSGEFLIPNGFMFLGLYIVIIATFLAEVSEEWKYSQKFETMYLHKISILHHIRSTLLRIEKKIRKSLISMIVFWFVLYLILDFFGRLRGNNHFPEIILFCLKLYIILVAYSGAFQLAANGKKSNFAYVLLAIPLLMVVFDFIFQTHFISYSGLRYVEMRYCIVHILFFIITVTVFCLKAKYKGID